MSLRARIALLLAASLAAPLAVHAQALPRLLVSVDATSDSSLVPTGFPGERFTGDFNEIYRSPNGTFWITSVRTDSNRIALISGSGTTVNVEVISDPFTPAPWNENDFILNTGTGFSEMYAINDSGDIAFSCTEAVSGMRVLIKRVGGVYSVVARQGEVTPLVPGGTENWGASFDAFGISNTGQASYRANATVGLLLDSQDDFVVFGESNVIQVGVTPSPVAARPYDSLGASTYIATDASATNWIAVASLTGATTDDDAAFYNGNPVIREGTPFNGFTTAGNRLAGASISGNGLHWASRGQQSSGTVDFIGRDGALVGKKGDPIFPTSSLIWTSGTNYARTFLSVVVDNAGNYSALGGIGDGTTLNDAGFVYNSQKLLIHHLDGLDVDGNAAADDNRFVNIRLGTGGDLNTQVLASDALYAVITVVDDQITSFGEGIVRIALGGQCNRADIAAIGGTGEVPGDPDGQLTIDDLIVFVNLFSDSTGCPGVGPCSPADVTGIGGPPEAPDGQLTIDDLITFVNAFSEGC